MGKKYLATQDQTVDGVLLEGNLVHYTVCSTAAATAAKTAALSGFKLVTGAWAAVRFAVTNTAANPTLNINGTGAKAIRYRNAAVSAEVLAANRFYLIIYDGSYWQLVGDLDTKSGSTMSITSITQGTVSGLSSAINSGEGSQECYYVPNVSRATKALIEYWKDADSTGTENLGINYGSRYVTNISGNMNAMTSVSIIANKNVACGVDSTGRPFFCGVKVKDNDHYRVTWFL